MKNQYFVDINDYRKYGLIRSIINVTDFRVLVAWMLTPDDGSKDGGKTAYLDQTSKWLKYDPVLFDELRSLLKSGQERQVSLIENTDLLLNAKYFSDIVPDDAQSRNKWFNSLTDYAQESDLVFLDPDNGLEVKSKPRGRKGSSKYVYWQEIERLWGTGKSLLIYQHFPYVKRTIFIQQKLQELGHAVPDSKVGVFKTSHVVFLLAFQSRHQKFLYEITKIVDKRWKGQIDYHK